MPKSNYLQNPKTLWSNCLNLFLICLKDIIKSGNITTIKAYIYSFFINEKRWISKHTNPKYSKEVDVILSIFSWCCKKNPFTLINSFYLYYMIYIYTRQYFYSERTWSHAIIKRWPLYHRRHLCSSGRKTGRTHWRTDLWHGTAKLPASTTCNGYLLIFLFVNILFL